jgi:hypothetical protein
MRGNEQDAPKPAVHRAINEAGRFDPQQPFQNSLG